MSDRPSIDTTVVYDLCDPTRERHQQALQLFDLADQGLVELILAPQGGRADTPEEGWLSETLQALVASGRVAEADQLPYFSDVTVIPFTIGRGVDGFREAWRDVWRRMFTRTLMCSSRTTGRCE